MPLHNLLVRVGADISGLSRNMDKAAKKVKELEGHFTGIKGKLAGALAAIGGTEFIHEGIDDAIQYEALMGTLSRTLGSSISDFTKWQETTGQKMGMSKLQAASLANTLSLNFRNIATSQKDLTAKTTKMMEVAAVISNKRGMAMEDVSSRIRSAMNQEADGADELGINVRVAAVQMSNAYKEMGVSGPWDKLSQNMRQTILYNYLLEETTKTLGLTLEENTQIRLNRFTAALGNVRLALGQAFLPILYTVLPYLTAFMNAIANALGWVYAFMRALFNLGGGTKDQAKQMNQGTQAAVGQTKAMNNLGKSIGKAGTAAKKAAKEANNLQAFDEINAINKATADTGGGGGGGGGGAGGGAGAVPTMPSPPTFNPGPSGEWLDKVSEKVTKLVAKFKEYFKTNTGWQTLVAGAKELWTAITNLMGSKGMRAFYKAFMEDLPDFFDSLAEIGGGLLKILAAPLEEIAGFLDNDMSMSWQGWGDLISGVYDVFAGTVGLLFPDLGNQLEKFGVDFDKSWKWFGTTFVKGSKTWGEVWDKFTSYLTVNIVKAAADFGEKVKKKISDMVVKGGISLFTFQKNGTGIFKNFSKDSAAKIESLRKTNKIIFALIGQTIKNQMHNAYLNFISPWKGIGGWFKRNVTTPVGNAISHLPSRFSTAVGGALRSAYNSIARRINGMLGGIAGIGFAGHYPFTGVTRYALTPLARGGIINRPMAALVGEAGREVVSPLDKLQGFITNAMLDVVKFQGGGGRDNGGDIILSIDGRQIARIIKPFLDKESKRIGTNIRFSGI